MKEINGIERKPGIPLYEKVAHEIRNDILVGKLLPGESISTENELCKKYSVSRGPVRQAMELLVKEKLITRTPGKGTFVRKPVNVPKPQGVDLINIGVFIDGDPEDQWVGFISEIIQGFNIAANDSWPKCRLNFQFHHDKSIEIAQELLEKKELDGNIFVPISQDCMKFLENLPSSGIKPVVSFFRQINTTNISQFYIDHKAGAIEATDYLLRCGHERIGLIVVSPIESRLDSKARTEGYYHALNNHGIKSDKSLVAATGMSATGVRFALEKMVKMKSPPTALLIGGQALINPCIRILDGMNITVPNEISIIAFDDSIECRMHEPTISVVQQPFARGTRLVIERLIAEIQKTALESVKVSLKPELLLRDSCCVRSIE